MTKSNPCILYTGDNEGPAVMPLETLIANFNQSGGWQFRHNEEDMRLELDSRGWYEGLHEDGHYLAVNLDKLQLMPHPSLYEKPGAVHPTLGGTPLAAISPPVAKSAAGITDEALRSSGARFRTWFASVEADAAKSPHGAFMASRGYGIAHTGGGCLAWEKTKPETDWGVWITNEDAGLGLDLGDAFQIKPEFGAMLSHAESGEFTNGPYGATIADCLAWAERALADPDAMRVETVLADLAEHDGAILHWQVNGELAEQYRVALAAGAIKMEDDCYVHPLASRSEDGGGFDMPRPSACRHRDDGRGRCIDCGTFI